MGPTWTELAAATKRPEKRDLPSFILADILGTLGVLFCRFPSFSYLFLLPVLSAQHSVMCFQSEIDPLSSLPAE